MGGINKLLSNWSMVAIAIMLVFPMWPVFSNIEGSLFPVTTKLQYVKETPTDTGTLVYVSFSKKRECEFIGLNIYQDSVRLALKFLDQDDSDSSRPVGDQIAGPWLIGTYDVKDTVVTVRHKCHPLWTTRTIMYP